MNSGAAAGGLVDLTVIGADLVATMDDDRRELPGAWIAITDGTISGIGTGEAPPARSTVDATGCLVTPGLVNTHHHIYQNLTRAHRPALDGNLFDWLTTLYPIWAGLDEEAVHLSTWIGLAELALGGCTTTMDHHYVHPTGGGDLIAAQVGAARDVGVRFHATRGSMSLSSKDGGLPPDEVVQTDDEILADSERLVGRFHDRSPTAMVQVALAPCSPFSVTPELMRATAELAERLDVRLHTHLAEDADEDRYCLERFGRRPIEQFEEVGWLTDRSWVAHCVFPNGEEQERLGRAGTGVAHCPTSNMMIGAGLAPVAELRAAGVPVGIGCDGSASTDHASLWLEARGALLLGRLRAGMEHGHPGRMTARDALEMATREGAACLGRSGEIGELTVGACADLTVWPLDHLSFAGALTDPIEAWLRCGPVSARHTIVAGETVVLDGALTHPDLDERRRQHATAAARLQGVAA
ncbi:MAG: 8-oxoguanine deaminase [Actinomycetota bacterium]